MRKDGVPKYHELMNPLLRALHELGGSGSIEEINEAVISGLDLPEDVLAIPHNPEKSNQTEIEYRLAWARTYLKKYGILDNSSRGVWIIVPEQRDEEKVNPSQVVKAVRELTRKEREQREAEEVEDEAGTDLPTIQAWLGHRSLRTTSVYLHVASEAAGHKGASTDLLRAALEAKP